MTLVLLLPAAALAADRPADLPLTEATLTRGFLIKYYEGLFTKLPDFPTLKPKYAFHHGAFISRRCDSWTNYANTFDGYLKIPAPGPYTFYLNSNDGSRLYIGDVPNNKATLVVDNDGLHPMQEKSGTIDLAAGFHQFTLQYFHGPAVDNQGFQLLWTGPGIAKKLPPSSTGNTSVVYWKDDGATPYAAQSYVQIEALVQKSPPQITLNWNTDPANNPSEYTLYRKAPAATAWGEPLKSHIPAATTTFADTEVKLGQAYEYKLEATIHTLKYWSAVGVIRAGIEMPAIEDRGAVILLVDKTIAEPCAAELTRLQQDLVGDGWSVIRHDVKRGTTVAADGLEATAIRQLIQTDATQNPNVQTVFIFGHVPVPHSGWYVLGHNNSDLQPHNADVYYGDLAGPWTDAATFPSNNVPNDGKFDQDFIPSPVELAVGRVDFANLKGLPADQEIPTLRQYLVKNHNFRHVLIAPPKFQGKIVTSGAASQCSFDAYENSWPLFGQAKTSVDTFTGNMTKHFQAMDHRFGAAYYPVPDCVAPGADFKVTFLTAYVSFVDSWNSNAYIPFLRQALTMPTYSLVALSANDAFYLSPMALGQTVGEAFRASQNSRGLYPFLFEDTGDIKMALIGDPTLRLNPIAPPTNLTATPAGKNLALTWTPSPDPNLVGYQLYRAASPAGPFTTPLCAKLLPPATTTYTDPDAAGQNYLYLLRALSHETTGSGTYLNPSQGAFTSPPR